MKNIALKLMYVGTAYHGWQVQKKDVTVAGTLERALESVVNHPVRITGCGRTDAGVHAKVYIANFFTDSTIPLDRLPLALNTRLPDDIVVEQAMLMPDRFSAIGSCVKKEYTYRIYNSRIRNAFYVDRAYFHAKPLDESILRAAAAQMVGTHNFAAMQSVGTEVRSTVRTVYYFEVERQNEIIDLRVCANGFLYNMVRAMAGTLLYTALGKLQPEEIPALLEAGDRTAVGPTLPPGGLYLTHLWYDDWEVAAHV